MLQSTHWEAEGTCADTHSGNKIGECSNYLESIYTVLKYCLDYNTALFRLYARSTKN